MAAKIPVSVPSPKIPALAAAIAANPLFPDDLRRVSDDLDRVLEIVLCNATNLDGRDVEALATVHQMNYSLRGLASMEVAHA